MEDEELEIYCQWCGGCGYIGCCGIRIFLETHVRGKTDCINEESFIEEILDVVESSDYYKINHDEKYVEDKRPS